MKNGRNGAIETILIVYLLAMEGLVLGTKVVIPTAQEKIQVFVHTLRPPPDISFGIGQDRQALQNKLSRKAFFKKYEKTKNGWVLR